MQPEKTCPIMPKNLLSRYHPRGNGRDLYIDHTENSPIPFQKSRDKTSFSHDFKIYSSSKSPTPPPLSHPPRPPITSKYHLNGGGRDNFIYNNNGGFENPNHYNPHNFFKKLRTTDTDLKKKKFLNDELESCIKRNRIIIHDPGKRRVDIGVMVERLNRQLKKNETRELKVKGKKAGETIFCTSSANVRRKSFVGSYGDGGIGGVGGGCGNGIRVGKWGKRLDLAGTNLEGSGGKRRRNRSFDGG
jgi:hypothetical protein